MEEEEKDDTSGLEDEPLFYRTPDGGVIDVRLVASMLEQGKYPEAIKQKLLQAAGS